MHLLSHFVCRRNSVEIYYGYDADIDKCSVVCQSIDVHPHNMAVALRYDRLAKSIAKVCKQLYLFCG